MYTNYVDFEKQEPSGARGFVTCLQYVETNFFKTGGRVSFFVYVYVCMRKITIFVAWKVM